MPRQTDDRSDRQNLTRKLVAELLAEAEGGRGVDTGKVHDIAGQFAAMTGGAEARTDLDTLSREVADAARRLSEGSDRDLADLLRSLAALTEDGRARSESLEDLAGLLESALGPLLSKGGGPQAEADRRRAYRDGARGVVGAALARRGIGTGGATADPMPRPAAAGMARHRLFWQNFGSLAPGLARLAATRGGAAAAAAQVADLLRALDLPDEVAVRAGPAGVVLDFAAPPDLDTARVLQRMLADAPVLDGWRLAIGGTET